MGIEFSVTQYGRRLHESLYSWDEETKTFSTEESNLVLDFSRCHSITFKTGGHCIIKTGSNCTFDTGTDCIFKTGSNCVFDTGAYSTFNTGSYCHFKTGSYCTFDVGSYCFFESGIECVVIQRGNFGVIQIPANQKIRLNAYEIEGYQLIKEPRTITIDGKEIELSKESYENLKKQLK